MPSAAVTLVVLIDSPFGSMVIIDVELSAFFCLVIVYVLPSLLTILVVSVPLDKSVFVTLDPSLFVV